MSVKLPENDHYGQPIPGNGIFFKVPDSIGEIISASTSYFEGQKPLDTKQLLSKYAKVVGIAIFIGSIIILIGRVTNPIWISVWIGIPIIISIFIGRSITKFEGVCSFIGSNGFAEYSFFSNPENIRQSLEVSFDGITDLLKGSVVRKQNYNYTGTDYFFLWLNNGEEVYKVESTHQNKKNEPDKYPFPYFFMALAADQWTKKLIQQMPQQLAKEGFLSFDLIATENDSWVNIKHIQLGNGLIEFIFSDKIIKYTSTEIKRIYFQNDSLFIEHKNYEKKLLGIIEKGNKNGIPLTSLSNQSYFLFAFEKLMGYKL